MTKVNESEFYMWRTVFAMAHADGIVTKEEIRFMAEALEDIPFSHDQKTLLADDIRNPKDLAKMFEHITDVRDQAKFFNVVRQIVHVDGDFGKAEQDAVLKLKQIHIKKADFGQLLGNIKMEFEQDHLPQGAKKAAPQKRGFLSFFKKKSD